MISGPAPATITIESMHHMRITQLLLVSFGILLVSSQATEAKRPNILFIIADDQSPFDLKLYNPESTLETPAIDRLAAEGLVL